MRWAPLLVLLLVAPGCTRPAPPTYTLGVAELEVNALQLEGHLLFRISVYNGFTFDIPDSTWRVEVNYGAPARNTPSAFLDANQTTVDLGARKILNEDLETKYVDLGDYWWNVTIRDQAGALVANQSQLYETCRC